MKKWGVGRSARSVGGLRHPPIFIWKSIFHIFIRIMHKIEICRNIRISAVNMLKWLFLHRRDCLYVLENVYMCKWMIKHVYWCICVYFPNRSALGAPNFIHGNFLGGFGGSGCPWARHQSTRDEHCSGLGGSMKVSCLIFNSTWITRIYKFLEVLPHFHDIDFWAHNHPPKVGKSGCSLKSYCVCWKYRVGPN